MNFILILFAFCSGSVSTPKRTGFAGAATSGLLSLDHGIEVDLGEIPLLNASDLADAVAGSPRPEFGTEFRVNVEANVDSGNSFANENEFTAVEVSEMRNSGNYIEKWK